MNIIQPDPISLTTHHLHVGFNDEVLANATGFIYKQGNRHYLITNSHVVTGRHPDTNNYLSSTAGIPNVLSTMFRLKNNPGHSKRENISLYQDEEMENPIWLSHPIHGSKIDVVAIPLSENLLSKYKLFAINDIQFDSDFKTEVSDEVFIVGYPFSETTYISLPIWKKASIASEPDISIGQLPKILVDTATRGGLSGSPAIMQRIGIHGMVDGRVVGDTIIGRIRSFIGIYSGRIGDDEFKAQLGIIWKRTVIEDIINQ